MTVHAPHDGTFSVGDVLAQDDLHVTALIEVDPDRRIRYVYATELADPSQYLRGEELILSVGVPVSGQSAAAVRKYVTTLKRHGVTALLIGLGDVFDEPPAALLTACRAADLPLLAQEPAVPFRRIVDWIDGRRVTDRDVDTRERDLGSMLQWFVAGTLGAGPVQSALAARGLGTAAVAVCAFPLEQHAKVHRLVDQHTGAVARLEHELIALCAQSAELTADLAVLEFACGVAVARDAAAMAHAIPEALEALAEATRQRRAVRIDEIATLDGLLAAVPKVRLVPFVHRLLVPVVDHDKSNGTDLMATLQAFLQPGNDLGCAAAQLFVHVNTLRNRLSKVAELTGANPFDETDRVNFRIALWAARHMGMREPNLRD